MPLGLTCSECMGVWIGVDSLPSSTFWIYSLCIKTGRMNKSSIFCLWSNSWYFSLLEEHFIFYLIWSHHSAVICQCGRVEGAINAQARCVPGKTGPLLPPVYIPNVHSPNVLYGNPVGWGINWEFEKGLQGEGMVDIMDSMWWWWEWCWCWWRGP